MSHPCSIRMSHVTFILHVWTSHVTGLYCMYEWLTVLVSFVSLIWNMNLCMNDSVQVVWCIICFRSYCLKKCHFDVPYHIYEWVMYSHVRHDWYQPHTLMFHMSDTNDTSSYGTWMWQDALHVWMHPVTFMFHMNESCHIHVLYE